MSNYYLNGYTPPSGVASREGVLAMQRQLNAMGANLKEDGVWGPLTQSAYQQQGSTGSNASASAAQQMAAGLGEFMQSIQGLIYTPQINYTPVSTAQLQRELAQSLRPGVDQNIAVRKEKTNTNQAELDADAYARGMGSSTYVTDMKSRQLEYEADDIAAMEGSYSAMLAQLLMNARAEEEERALEAQMYNAQVQSNAQTQALSYAQGYYSDYLAAQQAAAKSASSSARSNSSSAKVISPESCLSLLSLLTPAERGAIYRGATAQDQTFRDEMIASLGKSGYMQAQSKYPGT